MLQVNLKEQQKILAKQRKSSNAASIAYNDSSYYSEEMTANVHIQEVQSLQRNSDRHHAKSRNMPNTIVQQSSNDRNKEVLTPNCKSNY